MQKLLVKVGDGKVQCLKFIKVQKQNRQNIKKRKLPFKNPTTNSKPLFNKQYQTMNIQQIQRSLLQNQGFIEQLKNKITICSSLEIHQRIVEDQQRQSLTLISSHIRQIKQSDLDFIIEQITNILTDLISQKLQYELNQIIEENNNVLLQIKENLLLQQRQNQYILPSNKSFQDQNQISFSDVHKLIVEEKKKFEGNNENINDAELQKSLSFLVEFKFESIEEKVATVDKRLKIMEDKYETNLKSIWNVLSMTEGAVFDYINKEKQKQKIDSQTKEESIDKGKKTQNAQKKSNFFKLW